MQKNYALTLVVFISVYMHIPSPLKVVRMSFYNLGPFKTKSSNSTLVALSYSFLVIWLCHRRLSGWHHTSDPFCL